MDGDQTFCCPPSVVLLVLYVQVRDEGEGRIRMRELLRAGKKV